jgi:Lipase 3 N-terminal region
MVKLWIYTLSVLQLCALSTASPIVEQDDPATEVVTQDLYNILSLYQQYAAAAYCVQNFDATYRQTELACPSGNCPDVESADTNITLQLTA